MRHTSHCLMILSTLGLSLAVHAGPQTGTPGLDLDMLDLNGAPFRTFHLGHFSQGLDADHPTAATALPTEQLGDDQAPGDTPEHHTGMDARSATALPERPDIAPLLQGYDDSLLHPAARP